MALLFNLIENPVPHSSLSLERTGRLSCGWWLVNRNEGDNDEEAPFGDSRGSCQSRPETKKTTRMVGQFIGLRCLNYT